MSASTQAVFLSYASQDAEPARRIAEALRAAGIEVWFDQNELVGGDAWDAKIRKQIADCALFVPVISAATQARLEGYFRLEWKLAAQRTHTMAEEKAFVLPVVIDATRDVEAKVPAEFRAVQWTRLPAGETPPAFLARIRSLLSPTASASLPGPSPVVARADQPRPGGGGRRARFALFSGFALLVAVATGMVFIRKTNPAPLPPEKSAVSTPPAAAGLPKADPKFLAVLPLANLTAGPEGADFTDGMHDEIITSIGKVPALRVINRTSVLRYADPHQRDLRQIAADLGVGTVVEGTVRRAGNKVRITVQLVDPQTSRQLWVESYERELTDVFAIQAAIAEDVATQLDATLTAGERTRLARRPTENLRAYELYLQAKLAEKKLAPNSPRAEWERPLLWLEQAVDLAPQFAEAHALRSRIQSDFYTNVLLDQTPARREQARSSLNEALRLQPAAAETLMAAGYFAYACDYDYERAEQFFARAVSLSPNDGDLLFLRGRNLRRLGRFVECAETMKRSLVVDPAAGGGRVQFYQLSLLYLRRYAQAAKDSVRWLALLPELARNQDFLRNQAIVSFEVDGDRARLLRSLQELPEDEGNPRNIVGRYLAALYAPDLTQAAQVLADPALEPTRFFRIDNAPLAIVGMERAMVAYLQGQKESAAAHVEQVREFINRETWTGNVRWNARGQRARAAALSGQPAEAIRLAAELRHDIAGKDANTELYELSRLGRVYAMIGKTEEALAILRQLMTGPSASAVSSTPRLVRLDPCWSLLAADPRFEQILSQAKPL